MKRKFILGVVVVLLIVAILALFVSPLMVAPEADEAGVATGIMKVEATDLAVMNGEAVIFIESNGISVPVSAMEIAPWMALGASLSILAVVYRRRFDKLYSVCRNLCLSGTSANSAIMSGGPNKFILPATA